MTDVEKIVESLRVCGSHDGCTGCQIRKIRKYELNDCAFDLDLQAADIIEDLLHKLCSLCGVCVKEKSDPYNCEIIGTARTSTEARHPELMHLQITVYKDTGKFYTSCEVTGPNISMFRDDFYEFIKRNLPSKCENGYIVVQDISYSSDFHNCLIKMNDLFR